MKKLIYILLLLFNSNLFLAQNDTLRNAVELEIGGPNFGVSFNYIRKMGKEGSVLNNVYIRNGIGFQNIFQRIFNIRNGIMYNISINNKKSIRLEGVISHFIIPNGLPATKQDRDDFYKEFGYVYAAPYYSKYEINYSFGVEFRQLIGKMGKLYFTIEPIFFNGYLHSMKRQNVFFVGISLGKNF